MRLFPSDLSGSIIILKTGERESFIKNDIFLRLKFDIEYAPKIIDYGEDWIKEEYCSGIPLNRLVSYNNINHIIKKVINAQWNTLINKSTITYSLEEYKALVTSEITKVIENDNINKSYSTILAIKKVLGLLFSKLSTLKNIPLSYSHGDFQEANIILTESGIKVIDWESSSVRYIFYDIFILLSRIRTGLTISEAINNFTKKIRNFNFLRKLSREDIILLLIEELRFSVNEDFSENFFVSGKKTKKLCYEILDLELLVMR